MTLNHITKDLVFHKSHFMSNFKKFRLNRILVADDEEFCISSLKLILEHCGIDIENRVDYCITGMEAVN